MSETERPPKEQWTREQARLVLRDWRASGKSALRYATDHGFSASRLSYWIKQLEVEATDEVAAVTQFVHVPVSPQRPVPPHAEIEVELGGGLVLRFAQGVDTTYVVRLIAALQARGGEPC
jgi:transposase-like protein